MYSYPLSYYAPYFQKKSSNALSELTRKVIGFEEYIEQLQYVVSEIFA